MARKVVFWQMALVALILCSLLSGCSRWVPEAQVEQPSRDERGEEGEGDVTLSPADPVQAIARPLCPDNAPPWVEDRGVYAPPGLPMPAMHR